MKRSDWSGASLICERHNGGIRICVRLPRILKSRSRLTDPDSTRECTLGRGGHLIQGRVIYEISPGEASRESVQAFGVGHLDARQVNRH